MCPSRSSFFCSATHRRPAPSPSRPAPHVPSPCSSLRCHPLAATHVSRLHRQPARLIPSGIASATPASTAAHPFPILPPRFCLIPIPCLYPTSTAPPFTFTTSPEINPARGVHRNSTGPAISRVVATRPTGIPVLILAPRAGSCSARPTSPWPPTPELHSSP